jgi:hypothetical protein
MKMIGDRELTDLWGPTTPKIQAALEAESESPAPARLLYALKQVPQLSSMRLPQSFGGTNKRTSGLPSLLRPRYAGLGLALTVVFFALFRLEEHSTERKEEHRLAQEAQSAEVLEDFIASDELLNATIGDWPEEL